MARTSRVIAGLAVTTVIGGLMVSGDPARASSHREAPLISQDATADNTDVYAFRDPVDPTKVNLIANFIGLEDPAAGPNFTRFGDDVLYEIHINNTGDATDQVTYQFRFSTRVANPNTFLYNTGPLASPNDANLNVRQTYSVRKIVSANARRRDVAETTSSDPASPGSNRQQAPEAPSSDVSDASGESGNNRRETSQIIASDVPVAPANIGPRSTPNYEAALGRAAVTTMANGEKVFAGPRKDAFFVDLGSVFDLLGLRPLNGAHAIPLPTAAGVNTLAGKNAHAIALQVPIASLTRMGVIPTVVDDAASVIGVYASASRQQTRVLGTGTQKQNGRWVQVSRLGLPLVNEVLIPLGQKDVWNGVAPSDDGSRNFASFVLNPEPAALMRGLYGLNVPANPRTSDILPILQGAGAGLSPANYLPPADLLRVNLAVPVNSMPDRLGILAGDAQGFPNGRRLNDDVVDILLRVLAGGTPFTPANNMFPNNALTDGVDTSEIQPVSYFPYQAPPTSGYSQPSGLPS